MGDGSGGRWARRAARARRWELRLRWVVRCHLGIEPDQGPVVTSACCWFNQGPSWGCQPASGGCEEETLSLSRLLALLVN